MESVEQAWVFVRNLHDGVDAEQALHIATWFAQPEYRDLMVRAAAAGETENEDASDLYMQRVVQHAFEARVLLEITAAHLSSPELYEALIAWDSSYAPLDAALILIDEWDLDELADDLPLDPDAWWGLYLRLRRDVPSHALIEALENLRKRPETT